MRAKHATMLSNGRSAKGVPRLENWFSKIVIHEHVVSPAWRSLSKTATDILIVSIAKQGRAAAFEAKFGGRPVFQFTASEGALLLSVSRTTFCRAMKELVRIGFVDVVCPGGLKNGRGCSTDYTLSRRWKEWKPPERNNRNILLARSKLRG